MPSYSGKFQYLDDAGTVLQQAPCQVSFDEENCTITPSSGLPLTFDLGDVDRAVPGEWELNLTLYTGRRMLLRQFGPAFGSFSEELMAAWRDRTVRCLLLEDLEEVGRFKGAVAGTPAEIRIYGSNIAILPLEGAALQWRLAEVDSMEFEEATYQVILQRGADRMIIGKLAKKTEEFLATLRETHGKLRRHAAEVLRETFPFLNPDQLQRLTILMPEGRSVPLAALAAVHPKLPAALIARAVDEPLRPYFDSLCAKSSANSLMTGFKFARPDETESGGADGSPAESEDGETQQLFFWFFVPLSGKDVVAWEATTGSGRATYFFRAAPPAEEAISGLTRGLALVNFRREPVYLPDDSLEQQPRFHRYAVGCRKLPELRALRQAYIDRAIHSSLEEWEQRIALVDPAVHNPTVPQP
jgi:hypothetical protein